MDKAVSVYASDKPYVFVCYSHLDAADVHGEIDLLGSAGVNAWFDDEIEPGLVWRADIENAIRKASALVFYISAASSRSTYCHKEVYFAQSIEKRILPVYLEPTALPAGLNLAISDLQAIFRYGSAPDTYQQSLLDALQSDAIEELRRSVPNNLPLELARFVGRAGELDAIEEDLSGRLRQLTLLGPGGVGKTRLAVEAAGKLGSRFADGVWFAPLAPIVNPDNLHAAIAAALQVRPGKGAPILDQMVEALADKSLLLILDNCEHLIDACAQAAETLLTGLPRLCLLATSRQALKINGESLFEIRPLPLPSPAASFEEQSRSDVVSLFVDRASKMRRDFSLDPDNVDSVVRICRRLEGLPLSVELAAARAKSLPVETIADRLDQRLDLVYASSSRRSDHHRTLRECIDWSYELLYDVEKSTLQQLAVFAGGFSLEAAESVCDGIANVVDQLDSLVDKSLISLDAGGQARYSMLETIKHYALERLDPETSRALAQAHAEYFVDLGVSMEQSLEGNDQVSALTILDADYANVQSALDTCRESENLREAGLGLAASMMKYWIIRGRWQDGLRITEALLNATNKVTIQRAKAYGCAGNLAVNLGATDKGASHLKSSHEICEQLGDRELGSNALSNLAVLEWSEGRYDEAWEIEERVLAIRRRLGNMRAVGISLNNLGVYAHAKGEFVRASEFCEEGLKVKESLGDIAGCARSHANLGGLAFQQNQTSKARDYFNSGLAMAEQLGQKVDIGMCLRGLGRVALEEKATENAGRLLIESFELLSEVGTPHDTALVLVTLAEFQWHAGRPEQAAEVLGAADRLSCGIAENNRDAIRDVSVLAEIRRHLGDEVYESALAAGRAMTPKSLRERIRDHS